MISKDFFLSFEICELLFELFKLMLSRVESIVEGFVDNILCAFSIFDWIFSTSGIVVNIGNKRSV